MNQEPPPPDFPRLRLLDIRPYKDDEREGLLLVDRKGLFDDPVFVPSELLPILGALTGERDRSQIAEDLGRELGCAFPVSLVDQVVEMLDGKLCLEGERAERAFQEKREAYLSLPVRPPAFAGTPGYPRGASELRAALDGILAEGSPRGSGGELLGLVAPHIDLSRGRAGYAAAYGRLVLEDPLPELVLVFGTGHAGPSTLLVPSRKDYLTPLGRLPTDQDFVGKLLDSFPELGGDEHLHEGEHSLEFQAAFLAHVFSIHPQKTPPSFVFLLTGRLEGNPGEDRGVGVLLDALEEQLQASSRRVLLLAGADLSHVGPFFGDAKNVDQAWIESLAERDQRDLQKACSLEWEDFVLNLQREEEERRVCGTTPIFFVGKLAERLGRGGRVTGEILRYGASHEVDGSQCVTWASLAFEDRPWGVEQSQRG